MIIVRENKRAQESAFNAWELLEALGYNPGTEQAKGNWGIAFEPKGTGTPMIRINGLAYSQVDRGVLTFKKNGIGYASLFLNQIADYRYLNNSLIEISLKSGDVYYISLRG